MVLFCCYCNSTTVGHIGIRIFYFVVLSVITAPHNAPTPYISKPICLLFHLTYVNSNYVDAQRTSQRKREPPLPCMEVEAQLPPKILKFIKRSSRSS